MLTAPLGESIEDIYASEFALWSVKTPFLVQISILF